LWLRFAPITFPRASRPLSTKWNLEDNICELPRRWSMYTVKMVCDLLEFGFIWVAPVCLAVFPDSSKLNTSSRPSTSHSFTPNKTKNETTL
uniref:Uncharacterized protein n=1 Tax=Labrus bergylta TaxID=56723 RepID=A0A3Q3GKX8_9LABR